MVDNARALLDLLSNLLAAPVTIHAAPGGRNRKTLICNAGPRLLAVSQRESVARARLEALVLQHLGPVGLAPNLVARSGNVIVQEFIEGDRLPVALSKLSDQSAARLVLRAVDTLIQARITAEAAGLSRLVPMIGARSGWDQDLAAAPTRLAQDLGLDVPLHDFGILLGLSEGASRRFVKWDARPGNAILRPDGSVCWIDWEHAGSRRPVDDLVWFFADEWTPDAPDALDCALHRLADSQGADLADLETQFTAMAVAHSAMRLSLIYACKGDGPWWNPAACLAHDRVGVTPAHARRVALRAAGWSGRVPGLQTLSGVFEDIARQVA